jgi:hypothetical protein
MLNNLSSVSRNKSSVFLLVFALIVGGVGAQATGLLNTSSGGYLVCVNSKTKVVTHPGTSTCPKGYKKLILGAQGVAGADGISGAAGLSGKDGAAGKDGKTLWNGVKDPESTWGAPGDMFINSVTKTLFGPKDLTTGWPAGVSMVGPAGATGATGLTGAQGPGGSSGGSGPAGATGATGANGTNATIAITELFLCDGPDAGTVADEKCKIGMTGPGGGTIFFVDYNDRYADFNYLEAAPVSCEGTPMSWSIDMSMSVVAASGWAARAVGRGQTNTTAIIAAVTATTITDAPAATYADDLSCGSKTDWFLGSLGEMKLMYDNLQGFGDFVDRNYWSSSEREEALAWSQTFFSGGQSQFGKDATLPVRPVRAF